MKLSEFVKESLLEISEGALMAREEIRKNGGDVNPSGHFAYNDFPSIVVTTIKGNSNAPISKVHFDVRVEINESNSVTGETKGGILNVISAKADGQMNESTSSIQELSFDFALVLPGRIDKSR